MRKRLILNDEEIAETASCSSTSGSFGLTLCDCDTCKGLRAVAKAQAYHTAKGIIAFCKDWDSVAMEQSPHKFKSKYGVEISGITNYDMMLALEKWLKLEGIELNKKGE